VRTGGGRLSRHALIAGAGIGGLAAALALSRAGLQVTIFERAAVLEEFGAGLQLGPNATRVLERLDALEAVRGRALEPRAIRLLRGRDDAPLSMLPFAEAQSWWGAPYLALHRADLLRVLIERVARAPNIAVTLGAEVAGFAADEAGVSLAVKRGAVAVKQRGDLLVGADGLRSIVRERLGLGARDAATFCGRMAFRATIEAEAGGPAARAPEIALRLGPRAHLVAYPLRGGAQLNLVAVIESGARQARSDHPFDGAADRGALEQAFTGWSRPTRRLIADAQWRAWPIYARPPIDRLAAGRVALIGDAAHPMEPFLAQGAAQAIEDAGALGDCLAGAEDIAAALNAYSDHRSARVRRVQRAATAQGRLYHLSGPLALARDLGMRALGPQRLLRRYNWLYGA
jgi:salicylate hydroxylase